jgi:hypothetical protein
LVLALGDEPEGATRHRAKRRRLFGGELQRLSSTREISEKTPVRGIVGAEARLIGEKIGDALVLEKLSFEVEWVLTMR